MRSFNIVSLAVAAAYVFLPFVSAAPFAAEKGASSTLPTAPGPVTPADAGAASIPPISRRDGPCGLQKILLDVQAQLADPFCTCHHFTPQNATAENIRPVLKAVVSVFADATVKVAALNGQSDAIVFASVNGDAQVTISVIASLLATILSSLCLALTAVLHICLDVNILLQLIVEVALGVCLCGFIQAIVSICADLVITILPLVLTLAPVLIRLGLRAVGNLLNIC